MQRATPASRVILLLNQFDTCTAILTNKAYALRLLNDLDALAQKTADDQLARYCRLVRAMYPKNTAISNARKAALFLPIRARALDEDDPQLAAVCEHFAGQYFFLNDEYGKAFEYLLAANRRFQDIGYDRIPEISRYLYELAFNYYYFGDYDKAIQLLHTSAQYPAFNANLAIQTHNTLGMAYAQLSHERNPDYLKKAERSYRKAQQVAASYQDSLWIGITSNSLAGLYVNQQQWQAALQAYRMDYRLGLRFGGPQDYVPNSTALRIADVYWHLGKLDSCQYYLKQSRHLYERNLTNPDFGHVLNDETYLKEYYGVARNYYQSVHNLPKAYACLDSLMRLSNRINNRYSSRQVLLAEQKLLIQQHQSDVAALEKDHRTQQFFFWITGLVLALVALIFFLRYRFVRIKRHQERVINAEKEKSLRFEKRIIEEELERANADLTVFIDNLHEKNALIDTITAQLDSLLNTRQRSHEQQLLLDAQQHLVDASLLTNDDWDEFQRRFERVHPCFFVLLRNQYADVSPAEERLLALSKLNINSRQMSRMLGISPDSIRKTRYRLRKKLGIHGNSSLLDLLNEPQGVLQLAD